MHVLDRTQPPTFCLPNAWSSFIYVACNVLMQTYTKTANSPQSNNMHNRLCVAQTERDTVCVYVWSGLCATAEKMLQSFKEKGVSALVMCSFRTRKQEHAQFTSQFSGVTEATVKPSDSTWAAIKQTTSRTVALGPPELHCSVWRCALYVLSLVSGGVPHML